MKKYLLWKGFYHDFSTKEASASDPHQGACPLAPRGSFAPLAIYPGAAPVFKKIQPKQYKFVEETAKILNCISLPR